MQTTHISVFQAIPGHHQVCWEWMWLSALHSEAQTYYQLRQAKSLIDGGEEAQTGTRCNIHAHVMKETSNRAELSLGDKSTQSNIDLQGSSVLLLTKILFCILGPSSPLFSRYLFIHGVESWQCQILGGCEDTGIQISNWTQVYFLVNRINRMQSNKKCYNNMMLFCRPFVAALCVQCGTHFMVRILRLNYVCDVWCISWCAYIILSPSTYMSCIHVWNFNITMSTYLIAKSNNGCNRSKPLQPQAQGSPERFHNSRQLIWCII